MHRIYAQVLTEVSFGANCDSHAVPRGAMDASASSQDDFVYKRRRVDDADEHEGGAADHDAAVCGICMEPWSNSGAHRVVSLACGHCFGKRCVCVFVLYVYMCVYACVCVYTWSIVVYRCV